MQTELNCQSLLSVDLPFDPVPLLLLLLHPWADLKEGIKGSLMAQENPRPCLVEKP
jgi:hypothetical protein